MSFNQIPIIDIGEGGDDAEFRLAAKLKDICHQVGFFYVKNHGLDDEVCAGYLDWAKRFFDLPEAQKQLLHKENSPHFRGWEQLGSELTNNETDFREQLDLGTERAALADPDPYYLRLIGPNQWPAESLFPGFKTNVMEYMDGMARISRRILRLISASLGLDQNHIENIFGESPMPYCKLIRYPVTPERKPGVGIHKDAGFLSVLLQDEVGGLQAQNGTGDWIDIPPVPGALVVNLGEMLQIMTKNFLIATPHRVINRDPTRNRYCLAYFYNPDLNTRLEVLPIAKELAAAASNSEHHAGAGLMPNREQMSRGISSSKDSFDGTVYGYKYWDRWVRSYPELVRKHYPDIPA